MNCTYNHHMIFSGISITLLALYLFLSVLNCSILKYRAAGKVELFTKPLLLICLMFFYLSMLKANVPAPQRQWDIMTAMVFYAIGDFCLIWKDKTKVFAAGVISFVIGHIFYSIFLLKLRFQHSWIAALIALIVLIPCLLLLRRKLSKTDDPLADIMFPYSFFLVFMLIVISSTFGSGHLLGSIITLAGGIIFSISDSMIGIRATGQKIPPGESVMITYTLANILLAFGVLLLQM